MKLPEELQFIANARSVQKTTDARMDGRVCVVTGATSGVGREAAHWLARGGAHTVLVCRNPEKARAVQQEMQQAYGTQVDIIQADFARLADVRRAAAMLLAEYPRIDVLLNNAGIHNSGPFETVPLARQQAIVDVNVKGVLNGCHAAFPYLRDTVGACVVNMSSASAIYGQPSLAVYSATKFAVRGLTEALDLEWQAHGIRVVDVMPLFVQTAMVQGMDAKAIGKLGVNLGPEDVAATIYDAAVHVPLLPRVHRVVGRQAQLFYKTAGLAPDWLARLINRYVAGNH
jgi:short-subunit dehydrogenase